MPNKVEELGILEFMHQYEVQLYQDPKQIISPSLRKTSTLRSPSKEWYYWCAKKDENQLFLIKEEYPEGAVFIY